MSNNSPKITFEMLSDWHIGTGSGIPGSVDALVARDADGFPCIPAKTVVGIWRDAMETLTFGLDDGDENNKIWQNWVDLIFGSQPNIDTTPNATPRPAILSIQPARIDENLRNAIKGDVKLEQALTFVKPNTKIDSKSGTAETESLRFTEMGRIGSILNADFELDFTDFGESEKEIVKALLTASAALVERIGGNRRRGSGKCEMKVGCGDTDPIAILEKYRSNLSLQIPKIQPKDEFESAQYDNSSEWKRIEYSLKLETPVAIVTATLGNVSETLDFIPGTYLLPHITKHLKISKYVASGDFQVLPATICIEGKRSLPVPRVLSAHKVDGGFDKEKTVFNKLQDKADENTPQLKPFREGFVSNLGKNDKLPLYETTKKILLMHNTVEDEFQRPTENVGGVFSRQAIEAGQVLKGEIRFKTSIEKDLDFSKIGGYVRLGTSKKDDYGLACFEVLSEPETTMPELKENKLVVYLASDVLLRNGNLRQTNLIVDLKAELEKQLSVDLTEKESLIQVRRIESWHDGWGFPRPTFTAMAAGSVAVFEVVGEIKPQDLQNLELSGIGERRGEGYGQIKFNPMILMNPIKDWNIPLKDDEKVKLENEIRKSERIAAIDELKNQTKTADKFKKFIENLEVTAWREEIARSVLKIADDDAKRLEIFGFKGDSPSMSQIGGLRSTVSKVKLDGSNKTIVTNWLEHLIITSNRKDKWKYGFGKIKELFTDKNEVWTELEVKDEKGLPIYFNKTNLLISDENVLKGKLWAEAVKSLFDACARAHKRDQERKKDNREDNKDGEEN